MKIAIIGQGGHSKVIRELISLNRNNEIIAFLDDKYEELERKGNLFIGPIYSAEVLNELINDVKFFIAIGNNNIRKTIVEKLNFPIEKYVTLIHPTAFVSPSVKIGGGTVIMAGSVINAETIIGDHSIINTGAIIEHDNRIGSFVHISPNVTLTGDVKVEDGVQVGAGLTIIPKMYIGKWSVIGAGATVITSIPAYSTAVGIPAKVKKYTNDKGGINAPYIY